MRQLEERGIDGAGHVDPKASLGPGRRGGRTVAVNVAESPLSWLRARGMIDARRFEAGERLRADYEAAAMSTRVTMRWETRVDGGTASAVHPALAQMHAKRRFDAAIAAAGPGLSDVLWRVVCAGEGLAIAEKALGWPTRAGKLVLGMALDRIADHYGLH